MKKLFIVLAVASLGFVACNNDSSAEDAAKKVADSTHVADSLKKVDYYAAAAAAAAADTTHKMAGDTSAKK
jgi:hypothetical protein